MRWEISEKNWMAKRKRKKLNKLISFDLKCYKISHESIASRKDQREWIICKQYFVCVSYVGMCAHGILSISTEKHALTHIHRHSHWSHTVIAFTLNTHFFFFWLNVVSEPFFSFSSPFAVYLFIEKEEGERRADNSLTIISLSLHELSGSWSKWMNMIIKWRPGNERTRSQINRNWNPIVYDWYTCSREFACAIKCLT